MALQSPFFGKRDTDHNTARPLQSAGLSAGTTGTTGTASTASASAAAPGSAAAAQGLGSTSSPAQTAALARAGQAAAAAPTAEGSAAKLTVGPNIKLKGVEITDCDTLVVEGTVEATMDSRVIHIAAQGAFSGSADIDIAEIHGAFDGKLTVRQKLVIHSTGRVTGTVRYGRLVIEDGGQLAGDVALGGNAPVQATLLAA